MFQKTNQSLKQGLIALVKGYQLFLSTTLKPKCRFYPSCSEYCVEAIKTYNIPFALWLTFRRLMKCHPLGSSGYDPIPPKGSKL